MQWRDNSLCPNGECRELLQRNKKGEYPQYCPECDQPTGLKKEDKKYCPNPECRELQTGNKKGVYPKHCVECGESTEDVAKEGTIRLCPNVDCGEKLTKNKRDLYPKFCPEYESPIERRTDAKSQIVVEPKQSEQCLVGESTKGAPHENQTSERPVDTTNKKPIASTEALSCVAKHEGTGNLLHELQAKDKPTAEQFSYDSGNSDAATPLRVLICAVAGCGATRKRSKTGKFSHYCQDCKFDFKRYGE